MSTRKITAAMVVVVVCLFVGVVEGVWMPDKEKISEEPAYKEDEIIVKFEETVADYLEQDLLDGIKAKDIRLTASLDGLAEKYETREFKQLAKNFKAHRQKMKNLLKKDKSLLNKKEKHLLRRLKRAPKGAKVPDLGRIYKIKLGNGQSAEDAVAEYNQDPDVEYAELNYIVRIAAKPNDPNYGVQWPLYNTGQMYPESGEYKNPPGANDCDIDANDAWDLHTGSNEVIIAVIDTGVDYDHRDLDDNMWTDANGYYGYDFVNDDNYPMDDHGHGTHCAGIIAAEGNNGLDISGVCWDAKIMALKLLNSSGSGSYADAVSCIYYAVANGADITSNSWTGSSDNNSLEEAIEYAHSQGVVTVAAAGNSNDDTPTYYPACYDPVIAVAATDSCDVRADYPPFWGSNYGEWVDIAAPGVDILSLRADGTSMGTVRNDYVTVASGTSMACPHVAGACGLLLSAYPVLSPNDVTKILTDGSSVDPIADGICSCDGRLNVYKAIQKKAYFDKDYYNDDCNVGIWLCDPNLAGNGSQDVNVTTSGGDDETVSLSETDSNTGVFTGQISTEAGDPCTGDDVLQVAHGDIIDVTYEDADANDTAIIDTVEPNISDVNVAIIVSLVTVTFNTNEDAYCYVLFGTDCSDTNNISSLSYGTSHSVKLSDMLAYTTYYYKIKATDDAGNETIDDNNGVCYQFTTDGPNDIKVPADYNTIQEAINYSWDGGTVTISEGTYNEHEIQFKGKAITVRSTDPNDWDVVAATIIDGNGTADVITFVSSEDANSILSGLTISGGESKNIGCLGTSPVIKNCIIENGAGMGIWCDRNDKSPSPTIINNKIRNNCFVGIDCEGGSKAIIKNNWIYSNYGGIAIYSSYPEIRNNTIFGNTCGEFGTPYGIYGWGTSDPNISNCIIWGHDSNDLSSILSATYSCIEDCNDANGVGNICGDANDPNFIDADANDFHLNSKSPCINAGDTSPDYSTETDIDGEAREQGARVDMGGDETGYKVYNKDKEKWYTTIQSAINDSNYGDEIVVYPGTYEGTIEMIGHTCKLRSTDPNDRDVVEATIIAGAAEFYENDCNASLAGFTVRGITCNEYSEPTISNCIIKNNMDNGVHTSTSSPTIINCEIYGNNYGFYIDGGSPIIRNNTIVNNTSYGIYTPTSGSPSISNCIIWGHNYNDIHSNFSATYSCIQDPNDANGTGNISGDANDPNFVDPDANDFHIVLGSPCVNAGDPGPNYDGEKDIDGQPREVDGVVDMGADEYAKVYNIDQDKWFKTIQSAINASNYGDEIEVTQGTHQGTIEMIGHTCKLRSTDPNDRDVIEATIIAGAAEFYENDCNASLAGFTVRGIVCNEYSEPTIRNCIIKNNMDDGVHTSCSTPKVFNCEIYGNNYGFYIDGGSPIIRNNTIVNNTSYGIYSSGGSPDINNCIIWGCNDDLYGCSATYSCIEDGDSGTGNISSNPKFVDADSNDYHLDSNSPCINAGDPNGDYGSETDIDGDARVQGGRVDMGADESAYRVQNINQGEWYVYIQDALDDANDNDIIEVYQITYYEKVDFGGVSCTLRSTDSNDWDVVAATIIDGKTWSHVVIFDDGEDSNTILSGLTISGGDVRNILCDGTSPVIKNCIIENSYGAGIHCESSASPTIINNKIGDNDGSGIRCWFSSPIIKNNWIYFNYYGIYLYVSNPVIRNNTIVGNTDYGIKGSFSSPTISNCIIWDHNSNDIHNYLGNYSATYSCIQDCNDADGVGNICGDANDPLFVDDANDNYHLDVNSPCIDIGDPNQDYTGEKDIDGDNRVIDITGKGDDVNDVDMGGDEYKSL